MSNKQNRSNPIEALLEKQSVVLLDGALATELESYGCDLDDPLWSAKVLLEKPEAIKAVHASYYRAGADISITASYQATIDGFAKRGLSEEEAVTLIRKTVTLAGEARDEVWKENPERPRPLTAASVGPYGAYLADGSEYTGHYGVTDQLLYDFHQPRIQALVEAGADVLAVETLPSLQEAKVIGSILQEYPSASAWISFTLKDGQSISEGIPLKEVAEALEGSRQVAAIGVNCATLEHAAEALQELGRYSTKPLIVYPNSGEDYNPETKTWHGSISRLDFHEQSSIWYEYGARLIGGCCRTTPAHIKKLAEIWKS
ncbi:homocysteine S-methyltransferase [Halobacillus kuroshimensis]|uniref:Homocysteine S-methyltransferase n=1 Tax=Halobacillus kuroshimensis TaxID=302481 RepID=A0ABS3DV49_9BACI|nr:homocysteine S-methyltransferase [Halobacillus kuroshimensis]MBN8235197.1 homocysteine S-methyltransferase [Halobacillus kuroshimensis]